MTQWALPPNSAGKPLLPLAQRAFHACELWGVLVQACALLKLAHCRCAPHTSPRWLICDRFDSRGACTMLCPW